MYNHLLKYWPRERYFELIDCRGVYWKGTLYCIFLTSQYHSSLYLPSISWRARVNVCIHITKAIAFWALLRGLFTCYINACRHNHAISFSMFSKHVWALYSILWSHYWSFYILYPVDYLNKLKLPLVLPFSSYSFLKHIFHNICSLSFFFKKRIRQFSNSRPT